MADVLIVDDDPAVVELLTLYLEKAEFRVRAADTGPAALEAVARWRPDIVLLDIMLPGLDGYQVCQTVRQTHGIPIIFVTAKDDEVDPIIGLEVGADDYITKPFNPREVVARVRAVLRRAMGTQPEASQAVRYPGFEIDPLTREVHVHGQQVALTPREFDIVLLLARRPRVVFSRQQILQEIWGYSPDYGDYRTVDTHLKRARQKLIAAGMDTCAIQTVWGTGYRFIVKDDSGQESEAA